MPVNGQLVSCLGAAAGEQPGMGEGTCDTRIEVRKRSSPVDRCIPRPGDRHPQAAVEGGMVRWHNVGSRSDYEKSWLQDGGA